MQQTVSEAWPILAAARPVKLSLFQEKWGAAMSDEEWVDWGAADDDARYERVQRDFGFDARPKN